MLNRRGEGGTCSIDANNERKDPIFEFDLHGASRHVVALDYVCIHSSCNMLTLLSTERTESIGR